VFTVLPDVTYNATFSACESDGPFDIDFATSTPSTASLNYYGDGVTATNEFDPAATTNGAAGSPYWIYVEASVTVGGDTFTNIDSARVDLTTAPIAFDLMRDTAYCQGDAGVELWMADTENGVDYILEKNGTSQETITGDGNSKYFTGTYKKGTYTVYADNGSCTKAMSNSVTVNEITTAEADIVNFSPLTICPGGSVELGLDDSQTGVDYILRHPSVGPVTVAGDGDSISFGHFSDSTGYYKVEATNGSCSRFLDDSIKIVKKDEPQVFDLEGSIQVCPSTPDTQVYLTSSETGVLYRLYDKKNPTTLVMSETKSPPDDTVFFSVSDTATYYVEAEHNTSGCITRMNNEVTYSYFDEFNVNVSEGDTAICQGSSAEIAVSNGVDWSWSPAATLDDATSRNPMASPNSTQTYQVVATDGNGCQDSAQVTVTVNGLPNANAGSDQSICRGDSASLSGGGLSGGGSYASYSWSNASDLSHPDSRYTKAGPSTTTSYELTVTDANGCQDKDMVQVMVKDNPSPTVNDASICPGGSATLTATDGDSFTWNTGDTGPSITKSPSDTTTYTVTASYASGCSATASGTINVKEAPVVTTDLAGLFDICSGYDTTITASASGGVGTYDYQWSNGVMDASIDIAPVADASYKVVVTDDQGCQDSTTVTADVNALPNVYIDNLDSAYCKDVAPVTLQGVPSYVSDPGVFGPDTVVTDNNNSTATLEPQSLKPGTQYKIYYEYTDGNGCTASDTAYTWISNDSIPDPSILNLDSIYCDDDTNPYTIQGLPDDPNGVMTFSGVSPGFTDHSDGTGTLVPKDAGTGNYSLTYTYTTSAGCAASVTEDFIVGIPFTIQVDSNYCDSDDRFGLTVDKSPGAPDGKFIVYHEKDSLYSAAEGSAQAYFDPSSQGAGNYGIKYLVNDAATTCSNEDSVGFTVHPGPDARFTLDGIVNTTDDIQFCQNRDTVTMKGYINNGGIYSGPGVIGNKLIPEDLAPGDYMIHYTYPDSSSCFSTDSALVTIKAVEPAKIQGLDSAYCNSQPELTIAGDPSNGNFSSPWTNTDIFEDQGNGKAHFNPSAIDTSGKYTIRYKSTSSNGCVDSTSQEVVVNTIPDVSVTGMVDSSSLCGNAGPVSLQGNPTDSWGSFVATSGLIDHGDGTATFDPSVPSAGFVDLIYQYTDSITGCLNSDTLTLDVLETPLKQSLATVSGKFSYCANTAGVELRLNDGSSGVNYQLYKNTTSLQDDTTLVSGGDFTFDGSYKAGTYSVLATLPNGCADSMQNTLDITEKNLPQGAQPVTGDDTVALGATGSYSVPYIDYSDTIIWSVPSGASISSGTGSTSIDVLFSAVESGYDTLSVYGRNDCGMGDTAHFEVYILALPDTAGPISGPDSLCEETQNVTYSVPSLALADSIHWTLPNGFAIESGRGTESITVDLQAGASSGYVTARGMNASGSGVADTLEVTVSPYPDIHVSNLKSTYCASEGEHEIYATPVGGSYNDIWGDANIFEDKGGGVATFDPSQIASGGTNPISYTVTVNGCTSDTTIDVTIHELPAISFSGLPNSICKNQDPATLTGDPADGYGTFTGSGITDHGDGTATFDPANESAGTHTIIYHYEDSVTGCTNTVSQTVEILASPKAYTLSGGGFYCEDTPGNVLSLSGGEAGIRYGLIKNGATQVDDTTLTASGGFDFDGFYREGEYSVYAEAPNGCADSMQNSQTITMKALPGDAQPITGEDTVSLGGSGSYSVPPIANTNTYHWLLPSGASITAGGGTRSVDIAFSSTSAGYDSVAVYGSNGCGEGDTAHFKVFIQPLPDTAGPITGDVSLCEGDQNITYSIPSLPRADSIAWSLPAGFHITSGEGTESITADVDSLVTNGYVIARGINASGDGEPDSLYVNVYAIPDISISATDQLDCSVDSVLVVGSSSIAGASYSWSGGGKTVTNDSLYATQSGDYTLTVSADGCSNQQTVTVKEDKAPPSVTIADPDTLTCSAPQTNLDVTTDAGSAEFLWTASSGGYIVSGDSTSQPLVAAEGNYTVEVTDLVNGCTSTRSQWVETDSSTMNFTLSVSEDLTCIQDTALITATSLSDVTYNWSGPAIKDGQGTSEITVSDTGSYQLKVTKNSTGCSLTKSALVQADTTRPANVSLSKSSDIDCNNPQVTLTASTGTSGSGYTFYPLTTGLVASTSGNTAVVNKPDRYAVTVVHPLTGCTAEDTVQVKDNRNTVNVVVAASANTITCHTPDIQLDITSDTTDAAVYWKAENGGNITSGKTSATARVNAAGRYIAQVTDTLTGCTGRDTVNISENLASPNISDVALTPDSITCTSDVSLVATVSGYSSLQWQGPGNISHPNSDSTGVDQPGTYQLTATGANGCQSHAFVDVPADTLKPNLVYTDIYPELTCTNTQETLFAESSTPNVTYQWSRLSGSGTLDNPGSPTPVVDGPGTWEILVTGDNGCTSSGQVTIDTNYTKPVVTGFDSDPDSISCANPTVDLAGGSSTPGASLLWTTTGTGQIQYENTDAPRVDAKGSYTLTVTHPTTGCMVDSTLQVENNFVKPDAVVDKNVGQITCTTDTVRLDGSGSTGVDFDWNARNGSAFVPNDSVEQPYVTSDGWYILTVKHPHSGCVDKDSVQVTRNNSVPAITMGSVSQDTLNCAVDSSVLEISTVDQPEYWWSTADGNIRSGDSTLRAVIDAPGTYTFTAKNPLTGCTNAKSVTVEQNITQPNVSLHSRMLTCERDTVQIFSKVEYATDNNQVSYSWTTSGSGHIVAGDEDLPNPRITQSGTYVLTLTDDVTGCTRSESIFVGANTTPPDVYVDPNVDDITCSRNQVILGASTNISDPSYLWTTTGSGTVVNPTSASPAVNAPGWYTVRVTNNITGCYAEDSLYVDENRHVPGFYVDPVKDITCSRSTVALSAGSSDDVYYTWSGGPGTLSDPGSALTSVDAAGHYTLTVTDKVSGCADDTTITVYENTDAPSAPMASDTGSCYGSPVVAMQATGSNIRWYSEPALGAAHQIGVGSSYTPSLTAVGDSVFYVTQTGSNGCESSARSVVYSVYDLPPVPTATDKAICYGEPAPMLQAWPTDPAYPVNWYDASDSLLATSDQYKPAVKNVGTYEYGVTQVDDNGCESPQGKAYFTVHDLPAAPVVDEDTLRICAGAPPASFVAHGTNIKWYNTMPPASPVATGNVFTPSHSAAGTYTFYVTQSSSATTCESSYQKVVYIVQPNPSSHTVTGGGTYCEGSGGVAIGLDYSDASVSYELKRDGNTYITNVAGTDGALSFGTIEPEGTYTVYGTASNGCTSKMSGTAAVSVDSLPEEAGTITGDSLVCQGTAGVQYTVPAIAYADQYVWDIPAGAEITAGHDSRSITVHYTDSAQSGLVSVYGTNGCGDGAVSTGHAITVNPLPAAAGTITGPATVCQGARGVSFEVPVIDQASEYVWSVPPGATIVSGADTRSILVDFSESSTGGIVKVHGRNSCGSGSASAEHTVNVKSKPILVTDPYQSVCSSSDSLIADDPGSASITWSLINGQANIASPNSFETEVTGLGHGANSFQVTLAANGCADVDTVVIENNRQFVNAGADQTLCADSFQLSGSKPASGVDGTWSVEWGAAQFDDASQYNTTVSELGKGVNVLRWTLTRNGCSSYDEVTIINDSPTQAEAGIDQHLCADSTELDGNKPSVGGGEWAVLEGFVRFEDRQDPQSRVHEVAKGDNLLRWTITNNACSSADTVHLVNNQIQVEAGPDQVICDYKATMDAMAPGKGRGEWSIVEGSAQFGQQDDPKTDVFLLVSDTTVLAWNVYYNGCRSSDSLTIINNSPSRAEAGENQEILQSSAFLNATVPTKGTGTWSLLGGAGTIQDKSDPKSEVTELAYGKNLFQWMVSYEGCVSIDSVVIDNQSSGNITAGSDTIICTDNMRLNASEPVQGIGEWSVVKGSATFDDKNSHTTRVSNLSRGENILKWTVIGNGVISDKVTIVNNEPTQANAGPDMIYCVDSAQLSANSVAIGEGSWNLIAGEGTFSDTLKNNSMIKGLGNGKNTLRWTITNKNCTSTDDVVITNNQPTQADAGVDQTHCSDEAALYGNSPAVGEGLWTLVSGSNSVTFQDQTVGNTRVSNLGQGENILRWTITNGNCVSSDEVTITNDNPTLANAGRDKSICVDSFALNANEAVVGNGTWSVINGYGDFEDPSDHKTKIKNLDKGGNVLRWSIEHNGCISYDEVEISNDLIEAEAGYDQSLCEDSTILSANNAGKGEGYWSVVTGAAAFEDASDPNTDVRGLDHRSDNILKWTITHKACISTDQVTVKNNSPGIVYAGVDDDVCDDSYYLKANPNYLGQGKWEALSGGATIENDSSAATKVRDMGLGRNTFRWSVRRNGCVLHDDITIYNNMPVEAYAGENDTSCTNIYTLHAEEPPFGTGQWTVVAGSGEFKDAGVFNTTVSNLSQGANTFKWTVYNGSCSTHDEVTIVVNKPNTPRAGANQEICADSTTLQANMPGPGQNGQWEVVEGSGSFADPSDPNTKVTHMGYGTNTFRWNIRYKNCSLYDEVTITNKMPTKAYAGQNIHVCGDRVRLDAVEATIGDGRWSLVSGQASFSDKTNSDALVSNLGFGPNTLRWTTTHGSCTSMDEVTVYNDKATAYAGVDQEVYRDSTTLVASSVTRGEGKWIILGGSGTFDEPHASQTKVRDLSGGVNTFRWTITNNGCITSDEVSITYYEMPDPEFDVSSASGCPPLSVQFFNESLKVNSNFTWEFGDGNTSTNENPRHTFYQSGEYQVQLKTKGPDGSTVTEDTSIIVHDVPYASFDLAPDHLYIPEQHLQCYDLSVDADQYRWHFGDDSTSDEPSPMHLYQDTGTYDIRLEVWSRYGCYDDTTMAQAVTVEQSGKIRFPSGFTPNPNGPVGGHYNANSKDNNVFHPIVKGVEEYHLEIFNRWGVMVFRSEKVEIGWDGYYQGKLAEEGVYIYKVHGTFNNGTRFEKVGDFVLISR